MPNLIMAVTPLFSPFRSRAHWPRRIRAMSAALSAVRKVFEATLSQDIDAFEPVLSQ